MERTQESEVNSAEPETCCICLSEMVVGETVRALTCTHYFHIAVC